MYINLVDESHITTEHAFMETPYGFIPQCCLSGSLQCHDPFNLSKVSESPLSAIHHSQRNNKPSGFLFTQIKKIAHNTLREPL